MIIFVSIVCSYWLFHKNGKKKSWDFRRGKTRYLFPGLFVLLSDPLDQSDDALYTIIILRYNKDICSFYTIQWSKTKRRYRNPHFFNMKIWTPYFFYSAHCKTRCRKRPSAAHIKQSAAYATPGNPALKNYHLCYTGNSNLMNRGFILKWGSLGFFRGKEINWKKRHWNSTLH